MTDMTAFIQKPSLVGVAPTYTQCTATDSFKAATGARYLLHYKNAATPTGILKMTDQTSASAAPAGSSPPAGYADAIMVPSSIAASSESVVWVDNTLRFKDGSGSIQLVHATPTTLTVAIFGPFYSA